MNYIQEAEKRLRHYRDLEKSLQQLDKDIARITKRSGHSYLNAVAMDITGIRSGRQDEAINILFELQTLSESKIETEEEIEEIAELLKEISREPDCSLYGKAYMPGMLSVGLERQLQKKSDILSGKLIIFGIRQSEGLQFEYWE